MIQIDETVYDTILREELLSPKYLEMALDYYESAMNAFVPPMEEKETFPGEPWLADMLLLLSFIGDEQQDDSPIMEHAASIAKAAVMRFLCYGEDNLAVSAVAEKAVLSWLEKEGDPRGKS